MSVAIAEDSAAVELDGRADADSLFSAMYQDLHRMARRELAWRGGGVTLSATQLLHEAYIGISDTPRAMFSNRHSFMAYASRVMRGLIVDYARSRHAQKRGGLFEMTSLGVELEEKIPDKAQLTRLNDALDELAAVEPQLATIVELKFFCGFTFAEIAAMQDVSERTIQRSWEKGRIFLHQALQPATAAAASPRPAPVRRDTALAAAV
jgi:RNA polymerase sigma factor (TIGR02999 family)